MGHPLSLDGYFANEHASPISGAFTRRFPMVASPRRKAVDPELLDETWLRMLANERIGKGSIYIHVPFCANHCLFCGFYKNAWHERHSASYTDLLIMEMEREAGSLAARSRPIQAVYFGGGTPSALSANDLARLISAVRRLFPLTPDCEITVEGRIYHFHEEKVDACIEAGANRFSIGIQSFDTEVRRRQGRKSDRKAAISFMEMLIAKDRAAIVCDLMFGLPLQTFDIWKEDLRICTGLALDGADLYCLAVFPSAPLFQAIRNGKLPPAATLPEQGPMYAFGLEHMAREGWRQISNSHWARTTRERNIYNLNVKTAGNMLAYGSGAGGSIGNSSYSIAGDLDTYTRKTLAGKKAVGSISELDPALHHLEGLISFGIETGRLDLRTLECLPQSAGFVAALEPLTGQWARAGIVTEASPVLQLTTAGRFWQSNLIGALKSALGDFLYGPVEDEAPHRIMPPSHPAIGMQRAANSAN